MRSEVGRQESGGGRVQLAGPPALLTPMLLPLDLMHPIVASLQPLDNLDLRSLVLGHFAGHHRRIPRAATAVQRTQS